MHMPSLPSPVAHTGASRLEQERAEEAAIASFGLFHYMGQNTKQTRLELLAELNGFDFEVPLHRQVFNFLHAQPIWELELCLGQLHRCLGFIEGDAHL